MKISRYHPICLPQCADLVMRQHGQAACRLITAANRPTLTAHIGGSGKTLRGEFQRGSASARSTADSLRHSALVLLPIIACVYPCYKPASTRQLVNRVANELMRVNELHARRRKGVGIRLGEIAGGMRGKWWSGRLDLNQRPPRPERGALPTALRPDTNHIVASHALLGKVKLAHIARRLQSACYPQNYSPCIARSSASPLLFHQPYRMARSVPMEKCRTPISR